MHRRRHLLLIYYDSLIAYSRCSVTPDKVKKMPAEKMALKSSDHEVNQLNSVPIVDVTKRNFVTLEPIIRLAIENCDFVAIDCELSGLGDRKKLNAPSIEERFTNSSIVAKTRAIIALGLSIFKEQPCQIDTEPNYNLKRYQVQTYNIVLLCTEDYIVEPGSVNFLVKHGFNFNQQYSEGIPYYRGNDKDGTTVEENRLRNIFSEIIRNKKKIVLHNGFVDIIFLYQNLYSQLPKTLPAFLADLCEMFPNGIYDTKYIADYVCRIPSTFLEFIFKKLLKENGNRYLKSLTRIEIEFSKYPSSYDFVEYIKCTSTNHPTDDKKVCPAFANHGNCQNIECPNSHDVDYILAVQEENQTKKKKKKREKNGDEVISKTIDDHAIKDAVIKELCCTTTSPNKSNAAAGHRAGMDAFMTGYSYAASTWHKTKLVNEESVIPTEIKDEVIVNNMYLVCKEFPLLIKKSNFARNSIGHAQKYEKIMKGNINIAK